MKLKFTRLIGSISQTKLAFFILGIGSTIWFLIRVIPKPSRATYPCMKASAPFMSAFVLYLIGLASTVYLFKEKKGKLFLLKGVLGIVFVVSLLISFRTSEPAAPILEDGTNLVPNAPIGIAKGIFPGRVVWVMDKDATNEYCTNKENDYWFQDGNTDQVVVEKMLADGLKKVSGENTSAMAWDAIFKYFNSNHNKGSVGYKSGEKIVVKLNCTTLGNGGRKLNDQLNATPQLAMAILDQLVDTMNIAQADISIGDPYRGMPDEIYDPCHTKYPNVHFIEGKGTDGRELTKISSADVFFTSDNKFKSRLPQAYLDAAYLINMPSLKTHDSAGITLGAKNHQGSVIAADQNATTQGMGRDLHYDYPIGFPKNQVMGMYRHIVDYMSHKNLGGNTLIYIVDGLWSGRNWAGIIEKWRMAPFNNDWTSSLFLSQDPVALEATGFDFLYTEYKDFPAAHGNVNYPLVLGVQDYIYQAADPARWPAGIKYDPSTSGHTAPVASLGVEEHWNNKTDKQYSRNLGTGSGIELISVPSSLVATTSIQESLIEQANSLSVFPNPVNSIATLKYSLSSSANVHIEFYSLDGKQVITTHNLRQLAGVNTFSLNVKDYKLTTGTYVCKVIALSSSINTFTSKIIIR